MYPAGMSKRQASAASTTNGNRRLPFLMGPETMDELYPCLEYDALRAVIAGLKWKGKAFHAVAGDIATVAAVVLAGGDLGRAVRASMAVPAVLTPINCS